MLDYLGGNLPSIMDPHHMDPDFEFFWRLLAGFMAINTASPSPAGWAAVFFMFHFPLSWWEGLHATLTPFEAIGCATGLIAILAYWIHGLGLLYLDTFKSPVILYQCKIQKNRQWNSSNVSKLLINLISGQILVVIPSALSFALFRNETFGVRISENLPNSKELFWSFVLLVVIDEILFYYSHVLLHWKPLYRSVHKVHHEFTAPIGLAAAYCHPLEMLVSNVIPLIGGCVLINAHVFTLWFWTVLAIFGTQTHHSGYRFPWQFVLDHNPNFHDFHHETFNSNFGVLGILDYLHGTDVAWRQRIQGLRKTGCRDSYHPTEEELTIARAEMYSNTSTMKKKL